MRARACGHLPCGDQGGGKIDVGAEAFGGLVVSRGDGAELLDFGEIVFDQMPPAIHLRIIVDHHLAVRSGRNDRGGTPIVELRPQPISVECLVPQQASQLTPSMSGATPTLSWRCPGSRTKRTRLPKASTNATILVVRPPRERPTALVSAPPLAPLAL